MDTKNPETDIRIQPEAQRSKSAKPLESPNLYEIFRMKSVSSCVIPPYILL